MATRYVRNFSFKASLTDAELAAELKVLLNEGIPAVKKVRGVQDCRLFSGSGALRADLTITIDMDDAGVYERLLVSPELRPILARMYGAWDLQSASQRFGREVTPELVAALS